ncbi:hypothetical protein [Aequorivita echinoideorum]|uniref:NlpE N-terminal domain-containing protein n=1 Tax=Aequorivita echinoideorum TaxID=1549647 RepID=A0ABS5S177_9FLAO|nr:hypothetical protein [Aequorivita echinoideorum]MBT0606961.1 hypothetical protein [Aequorivita echinoideorum]
MKKILLLFLISMAIFSCKNSEEKNADAEIVENSDNLKTYQGEFIYSDDASVLMGKNFIYGVSRNSKAEELAKRVDAVKNDPYDMVGVSVKGVVSKNNSNESQWEEVITISEIVSVSNTPSQPDVKIEEKKN